MVSKESTLINNPVVKVYEMPLNKTDILQEFHKQYLWFVRSYIFSVETINDLKN